MVGVFTHIGVWDRGEDVLFSHSWVVSFTGNGVQDHFEE